jgi:enamine deaminase RidA (YjgF/YER057c/UK114 family)
VTDHGGGPTELVNPEALGSPRGYSNGALGAPGGRLLCVAGQVGWDSEQRMVPGGFAAQFAQALRNVVAVVEAAGGRPEQVLRLRIHVLDREEYLAAREEVGRAYREVMGRHYPAMALFVVAGLLDQGARVEIEADAVVG